MPRLVARRILLVSLLAAVCSVPRVAAAQPVERALVVGTKAAPPFAMQEADGTWSGISIDLWREIADRLEWEFEIRETDLPGLLAGVEDGTFDAGVAAITVTREREEAMDFTQPFHVSGLGIAVRADDRRGWLAVLEQFLSIDFLGVISGLVVLLLTVGWLVWIFERRANEHFGGSPVEGIGSSFWWSAVTMTTVGYGDKAPQTVGGRVVALFWMFAALIVISSFTASITASLTIGSIEGAIAGPDDLPEARVASVPGSTSADYLSRLRIPFVELGTPADALASLDRGELDAVVYDAPILQFEVRQRHQATLRVLPETFERQLYAIAVPTGSPLRESINRILLDYTGTADWQLRLDSYLGEAR